MVEDGKILTLMIERKSEKNYDGHTDLVFTYTCSFVVLPRDTNTMWNPVRPATGTKNRPATHITAILGTEDQGLHNKCSRRVNKAETVLKITNKK